MWPFKKKAIKKIDSTLWGHLFNEHGIDVDTLSSDMRCVEREGPAQKEEPVTYLRVFRPSQAQRNQVEVTGWETFDQYPHLIQFEGYIKKNTDEVHLEPKSA
jgi:hypothetical protein